MSTKDIAVIQSELAFVKRIFEQVVAQIPAFDILSPQLLPYKLKPHTRSIS